MTANVAQKILDYAESRRSLTIQNIDGAGNAQYLGKHSQIASSGALGGIKISDGQSFILDQEDPDVNSIWYVICGANSNVIVEESHVPSPGIGSSQTPGMPGYRWDQAHKQWVKNI